MDRLWEKVDRSEGDDACWTWQAGSDRGYGRIIVDGENLLAHRVAYELMVGPIPIGHDLHHRCENRACVNPRHLEPLTRAEHATRGGHAGKTHCPQGHPYDDTNTIRQRNGHRLCRQCQREYGRQNYARNRDKILARKRAAYRQRKGTP